ncbi:hypothetical protein ACFFRR_001846 [Megaselia abdita]
MVKIGRPRKEDVLTPPTAPKPRPKSPPPATSLRTGGRIKKAKVVFDPSDNYLPKKFKKENDSRKNDSNPSSPESNPVGRPPLQRSAIREDLKRKEPEEQCSICSKYEAKRMKLLIFCLDCNYRVHPKCLNLNYADYNTLKDKYHCEECITCVQCYEGKDDGPLVTCRFCIDSYHYKCHAPEVSRKNADLNDWACAKCAGKKDNNPGKRRSRHALSSENGSSKNSDVHLDTLSLSSLSSIVSKQEPLDDGYPSPTPAQSSARGIKHTKDFPEEIPSHSEVQGWSTQQIHKLFEKAFPEESKFITNNEIDGQALLLLTREDVVSKELPWKLGGLLKFYSAIVKIQNNTKNNAVGWS